MLPSNTQSSKPVVNARRVKNLYQSEGKQDKTDWTLVEAHLPLVKAIVGRMRVYFATEVDMQDIYSIGVAGLISASHNYDPKKNTSFGAYAATRVRGALLDEMRRLDWLPRAERVTVKKFRKAVEAIEHELGRAPSDEEIMQTLGLEKKQLARLKERGKPLTFVPLMTSSGDGQSQESPLQDFLSDSTAPDARDTIEKKELIEQLRLRLDKLPEIPRKVLAMYYLNGMLLSEIALALGVNESRVCQIHGQAIKELRKSLELHLYSG